MKPKNIDLTNDISAFVKHAVPVKVGSEAYRVIIGLLSHNITKNQLIKDYFVWVTSEFLEDNVGKGNTLEDAKIYALDLVKKRFIEENSTIPKEDGANCSNNKVQFVNPKTFTHPEEK